MESRGLQSLGKAFLVWFMAMAANEFPGRAKMFHCLAGRGTTAARPTALGLANAAHRFIDLRSR